MIAEQESPVVADKQRDVSVSVVLFCATMA